MRQFRFVFGTVPLVILASTIFIVMVHAGGDFSIAANPTSFNFNTGSSGSSTITVTSIGGFNGNVNLNTTVSPSGLACSVIPATVNVPGNLAATATLVCSGMTIGTYTVIVTGTNGVLSHSVPVTVNVQDFSLSLSPATLNPPVNVRASATVSVAGINGFSGTVTFAVSTSPSGPTCSVAPASVVVPPSPSTASLGCTGSVVGNFTVAVTGTSGSLSRTTSLLLRVSDFSMSVSPGTVTVDSESIGMSTVSLASQNGFSGVVNLTVSSSPSGLSCSLSQQSLALTVTAGSTLSCSDLAGTYSVTVTATSGSTVHTASATFTVQDFTVAGPTAFTVNAATPGSTSISLTPVNGFSGIVDLTVATLPSTGLSCTLSPTSASLGVSAMSNLSCAGSAGVYTVRVTGTNGILAHTVSVAFTVQDVLMVAATTGETVSPSSAGTTTIMIVSLDGYTGTVGLTTTITPANGLSCTLTPSSLTMGTFGTATLSCSGSPGVYKVNVTAIGSGVARTLTVTYTVEAAAPGPQSLSLYSFLIMIGAAGAGLMGVVMLKRLNSATAPFETFYNLIGGELQPPKTLLILGDPGAGTTTLGLELLHHRLVRGGSCGLLTYDAFPSELLTRMRKMGLDTTNNINDGTLKIVDCYSALAGDEKAEIRDPLDFTEISIQVTGIIDSAPVKPVTILLDSITSIFTSSQPAAAINFLRVLGAKIKNSGGIFIITGTKGSIPSEAQSKVEAMVDGVIELGSVRKRHGTTRTLLIKKLAGRHVSTIPAEFEIASNSGIVFKRHRINVHWPFHHTSPRTRTPVMATPSPSTSTAQPKTGN